MPDAAIVMLQQLHNLERIVRAAVIHDEYFVLKTVEIAPADRFKHGSRQPLALVVSRNHDREEYSRPIGRRFESDMRRIVGAHEEVATSICQASRCSAEMRVDPRQIERIPPRDGRPHRQQ